MLMIDVVAGKLAMLGLRHMQTRSLRTKQDTSRMR